MAFEVLLPKLGLTMDEGTILSWLKQEGDEITKGEPLFEVETDKVVMEVETPVSGILGRIVTEEGSTVPVGQVVAVITQPDEAVSEAHFTAAPAPVDAIATPAAVETTIKPVERPVGLARPEGKFAVSPAARRLAREHGINLSAIVGTGPAGRIVEHDVEQVIRTRQKDGIERMAPESG